MPKDSNMQKLVMQAKQGSEDAFDTILHRLEPKIKNQCRKFFVPGGDAEDILQEARIGLYRAIQDYNTHEFDISFENFALQICIRRRIITIIASSYRGKSEPLNASLSLDMPIVSDFDDSNAQTAKDLVPDEGPDPFSELSGEEDYSNMMYKLYMQLTDLESKVLYLYEQEYTYREIAEILNIQEKCVDNSLMRIRKKAQEVASGMSLVGKQR